MQTEKICQHELYLLFLPSTNQPDKDISALPLVLIKFSQVAKLQSKGFCSYSYRVAELGRWIVFSVTLHYLLTGIGTSFCQVFTCTTILPVHMYRYWHNYLAVVSATPASWSYPSLHSLPLCSSVLEPDLHLNLR